MSIFNGIQEYRSAPTSFKVSRSDLRLTTTFSSHTSSTPFVFTSTSAAPFEPAEPRRAALNGLELFKRRRGGPIRLLLAERRETAGRSRLAGSLESINRRLELQQAAQPGYAKPTISSVLKMREKVEDMDQEEAVQVLQEPPVSTGRVSRFKSSAWSLQELLERVDVLLKSRALSEDVQAVAEAEQEPQLVEEDSVAITNSQEPMPVAEGSRNKVLRRGVSDTTALIMMKLSKASIGYGYIEEDRPARVPDLDLDETLPLEAAKDDEE